MPLKGSSHAFQFRNTSCNSSSRAVSSWPRHPVDGHELVGSLERVAEFRGAALLPLADVLRDWQSAPPPAWRTWRRNQLLDGVPVDFAAVLKGVIMFADPALSCDALGAA
jgi:hypothetical protein